MLRSPRGNLIDLITVQRVLELRSRSGSLAVGRRSVAEVSRCVFGTVARGFVRAMDTAESRRLKQPRPISSVFAVVE